MVPLILGNPYVSPERKCITVSLVLCLAFAAGMMNFESESGSRALWVDQHSQQMTLGWGISLGLGFRASGLRVLGPQALALSSRLGLSLGLGNAFGL